MKISVVTNAYNQGRYLAAATDSVLSQTGPDVEYLIVDPGSTDRTSEVLEKVGGCYPDRFTVIREPDNGPADGLNRAFSRATGDWFIYLNADDVFLPGAFADAARWIERFPDAGAIIGNGYIVDDDGRFVRRAISTPFTARRFVQGLSFALQQSTFYRADAFRKVGGFNLENTTSWDAELLIDLDRAGFELVNAPGFWSLFRMQPDSITVSQRYARQSLQTHLRYFREEMGRERTDMDLTLRKLRQLGQRLTQPGVTMARLKDQLFPRDHVFSEALPPDWTEQ